jgi:hypothetical protein
MTTETFKLSQPLKTHDGELTALTLQAPTARAFVHYGEPFTLKVAKNEDGEPNVTFVYDNNKVFMQFLTDMVVEKVDDLILESLNASDFIRLRNAAAHIILMGQADANFTEPSAV